MTGAEGQIPPPSAAPTSAAAGRARYHHGDLRRALVRAARELLAGAPDQQLSLRQVAKRAGVSHAAPYRHFDSLDALLDAVAAEILSDLADRMRSAVRHAAGQAHPGTASADQLIAAMPALQAVAAIYVRFVLEQPAEARLVFSQPKAARTPDSPVADAAHQAFAVLVDVLAAGQQAGIIRAGDPQALATTTWALLHGLAMLVAAGQLTAPEPTPAGLHRLVAEQVDVLLAGLAARPSAPPTTEPDRTR
jgi:AcrR family transcriptional regulator